jgi:hypothetical protein
MRRPSLARSARAFGPPRLLANQCISFDCPILLQRAIFYPVLPNGYIVELVNKLQSFALGDRHHEKAFTRCSRSDRCNHVRLGLRGRYAAESGAYVPTSWTGGYWGLTLGWGYLDSNVTDTPAAFCTTGIIGCPAFGPAFASAIPGSYNMQPNGFLGGVEFGYNWQVGRVVYGLETDFSGANINGSTTSTLVSNVGTTAITSWERPASGSRISERSAPGWAGPRSIRCCSTEPAASRMAA